MSKNMNLLMENWRKFINEAEVQDAPDPSTAQQLDKIIKLPYVEFVQQFGKLASDPKVQAVLKYGLKDGQPDDEKVQISKITPNVTNLKPTQNEIDMNGSLKWAIASVKSLLDLLEDGVKTPGGPIVTAAEGTLVIDGHHRWSQVYCINPNAQISAVDINVAGADAETYLKIMQLAIAADIEKVPTQKVQGTNLLDPSLTRQQLTNWLTKFAPKEVLMECGNKNSELSKKIRSKINTAPANEQPVNEDAPAMAIKRGETGGPLQIGTNLLAQLVYNNILKMRQTSQPVSPAPKRDFMPQVDTAKNWMSKASSGELNFKDTAKLAAAPAVQKESLKKIVRQVIRENLKRR